MDYAVHGILQARTLEWVAISFSRGSSQPRDRIRVSRIAGRILYQLSHKGSPGVTDKALQAIQNVIKAKKENKSPRKLTSITAGSEVTIFAILRSIVRKIMRKNYF